MGTLPLKTRILKYAIDKGEQPFTLEEVMAALEPEYRGYSLFTPKMMKNYYESFIGIGFFKTVDMAFDNNGELVYKCVATNDAFARSKYFK